MRAPSYASPPAWSALHGTRCDGDPVARAVDGFLDSLGVRGCAVLQVDCLGLLGPVAPELAALVVRHPRWGALLPEHGGLHGPRRGSGALAGAPRHHQELREPLPGGLGAEHLREVGAEALRHEHRDCGQGGAVPTGRRGRSRRNGDDERGACRADCDEAAGHVRSAPFVGVDLQFSSDLSVRKKAQVIKELN